MCHVTTNLAGAGPFESYSLVVKEAGSLCAMSLLTLPVPGHSKVTP